MKKKISAVLAISIIASNSMPAINVFADEVIKEKVAAIEKQIAKDMQVGEFKLKGYNEFNEYNKKYQVKAKSITNNGGNYPGTKIENAIDGELNTHWETSKPNTDNFKNEVVIELEEVSSIDRVAYATRQDGAKGKGYPTDAKIYVSKSGNEADFVLAGSVAGSPVTGGMVEFKFDTVKAKKIKFVFDKANQGYASASEFWIYKEDKVLESIERLFTDSKKNEVSTEFNSKAKLEELEANCKEHPFYESFKDDINDAKILLEENTATYTAAKVSKFRKFGSAEVTEYDKDYKLKVSKITTNGRHWDTCTIDKAIDGKLDTYWHSGATNNANHTNEVIMTLDELQTLDRVVYTTQRDRGFAQKFEIYTSKTLSGDTFTKVTDGNASITKESIQIKFNPTEARRVKFVFKQGYEGFALASEFGLYKPDSVMDSVDRLFTNDKRTEVSEEFKNPTNLAELEKQAKEHPFYEDLKEDINDAKILLEGTSVNYAPAKVSKFKKYGSEELVKYDEDHKLPKESITKITTNGSQYTSFSVDKAIDGDINTYWHSDYTNSDKHTNEVVMTLDKLQTIDRIVYTSLRSRGFAEKFEIQVSKTLSGDTFEKVTDGSSAVTSDSIVIKFNPTEVRRIKFVFKKGYEGFALASEFGLYTPDDTINKMENLFTDINMNKLSEEFDTLEELKVLEDAAKEHPFYNDFKEDLANAKAIIETVKKESTVAKTKNFLHVENKEYLEKFQMSNENIKSITNNGGAYAGQTIKNAVDGNLNIYWETNSHNTETWKNEINIEFKDAVTLDRIAYGARPSDRKGFMESFEIYGSTTTKGNTFELVATAKADSTTGLVEAKFEPTKFQRLKIKVIKANQNWPTINELMFFEKDVVADKVYDLFTDGLMNELKPAYNSMEALTALEKEIEGHPISDELQELIDMAKALIESPEENQGKTFELESRGNSIAESQKRKVWNFQDWQPTGIAAKSGDKIVVYVDAEPGTPLPKLMFKQTDSRHNGTREQQLVSGKNEITVPEVEGNDLRPGTAKGVSIYTINPYTEAQQIRKPKIRIVGGFSYPHFIKGVDTDEEVMKELREYNDKLKADPTLPDVFDVFSDKTLVNVKASYALDWYTKNKKVPSYTANKSDKVIREAMNLWGFDDSKEVHSDFNFRYVTMVKYLTNGAFMNAGNGITGFNYNEQGGALNVDTGWGFMHEMGHNFDTGGRTIQELTNNILPLHIQRISGQHSRITAQNLWDSWIFPNVSKEDYSNNEWYPNNNRTSLTHLAPLWQLQIYDDTFWPRFEQQFRERNLGGGTLDQIHTGWAIAASDVLKLDLTEHFARHGFYVNDATKEHMSKYPKLDKKLWYISDDMYMKKGEGFNDDVTVKVKTSLNANAVKLDINIDKVNYQSLIGYEIFRDGKRIGFTNKDSFTDNGATQGANHEYKVVPYDNKLNIAEGTVIKAHQPKLETVDGLTLHLNEEFDASEFVKATDYEGNEITNIKITDNVDTARKGEYKVTYEVTDEEIVVSETINVNVVSEYDYLSDREWKSVQTGDGTPTRNNSIKGRTLGEIKDYEKGIRVHANGYVVYDLGEHNYDNFEVKVGVDMNLIAQDRSSITFKVVGDGQTLATTKVLKHEDNMQYINVPIKGVKELRIEVNDGGNGITSDHGIMVEPKLTINNAKPKLTIPESQIVEIGQTPENLVGTYKAVDAEDGNITNKVVVSGEDKVNLNRSGRYTLTYTVTDNDGNTVEKTRLINVVHPDDISYLSDLDWKSATSGWEKAVKDKSVGGGKLKLTNADNEEVVYDKGIGTHAYSEIVYDLNDKNATLFSTVVGVDRAMLNRPSSIEFKIYVDDKLEYSSGVMKSNDPSKYVELDIEGAKELKLVATTAGDGNASDHANWADAKFYSINADRVFIEELTKTLEEAKKINAEDYTDESYEVLANTIAKAEALLEEEKPKQETIDAVAKELKASIEDLVEVNLTEVVKVPDTYLVKALSKALGKEGNFTIGDMRKLETLDIGYGVVNLEGLQHAKNLKTITGESNEVKDLRPLSKLEKLTEVNFRNQYVSVGELKATNGVIKVNTEAYNRQGENVATKVVVMDKTGKTLKEQYLDGTTKEVDLDVRDMQSGFYSVHVTFEDAELSGTLLYMVRI